MTFGFLGIASCVLGWTASKHRKIKLYHAYNRLIHSVMVDNNLFVMLGIRSLGSASAELGRVHEYNVLKHMIVKRRNHRIKGADISIKGRYDVGIRCISQISGEA